MSEMESPDGEDQEGYVEWLEQKAEIARLRGQRKPVAWCVQAAAGSMGHAGTHSPIHVPCLIQVKDEAYARMMATVYGHKILWVVEPTGKEVPCG